MNNKKIDPFILAPTLVQHEIFNALNLKDKAALVRVSKSHHSLFQNHVKASKFLQLIAQGRRYDAEQLLMSNIELLSIPANVTDCSNRSFENITAFEYAFWAKDIYTCRMLLKYMNEEIRKDIFYRCKKIEIIGLSFKQNDQIINGSKHYDFGPFRVALRHCLEARRDGDITLSIAQEALLMAQDDVPAHVAQEYLRLDRSFDPLPSFSENILPTDETIRSWFPSMLPKVEGIWPQTKMGKVVLGLKFLGTSMGLSLASNLGLWLTYQWDTSEREFEFTQMFLGGTALMLTGLGLVSLLMPYIPFDSERNAHIRGANDSAQPLLYSSIDTSFDTRAIQLDLNAISHLDNTRTAEFESLLENLNPIEPTPVDTNSLS